MHALEPVGINVKSDTKLTLNAICGGQKRSFEFIHEDGEFPLLSSDEQFQLAALELANIRAWSSRAVASLLSAHKNWIEIEKNGRSHKLKPLTLEVSQNSKITPANSTESTDYIVTFEDSNGDRSREVFSVSGSGSKFCVSLPTESWTGVFNFMDLKIDKDSHRKDSAAPLIEAILSIHKARDSSDFAE